MAMMLGHVKNRQPVLFHSHPGQGLNTFPATLNSLTTDAKETGMVRYCEANLERIGYLNLLSFQGRMVYNHQAVVVEIGTHFHVGRGMHCGRWVCSIGLDWP